MTDIYTFLDKHTISYQKFDHPAVFTCEEAERLCPVMPGVSLKNLFLRDKNGKRHFLVIVGYDKSTDLKGLKEMLGTAKLSFASPECLQEYLGVAPGSVSLLGLINDRMRAVEVIIDRKLWGQSFQCHPLVNTATLVVSHEGIKHFLEMTAHTYQIVEVPSR